MMTRRHRNAGTPDRAGRHPLRGPRRLSATVALGATVAVLLAACGGGGGGGAAATPSGATSASAGTPKTGGTLSFAEYSPPVGLDPIIMTGGGVTGLIETTAIYDTLMRYDFDTGKYVPGTADSATPNADHTVWTIKIHPGITFSDGTPYDADAVAFGLNRFRSGAPDAPPCAQLIACPSTATNNISAYVKDVQAVDQSTVQVTLKLPWASFPELLATEPGLIPSPTALKKCDGSAPATQCSFNTAPVGAGPFMVTSFKPGEAITMTRNPHYWGGQVYLDGLRFVNFQDGGGLKTLDALNAGTVQAAFLRDPVAEAQAHAANVPGYSALKFGGNVLLFNAASPATSDVRVRQAVAAAVDPNVVNQRAYQGKAIASSQLFTDQFRWYPGVPGPKYDPAHAKDLVNQAKAAGWDGKLRLLAANTPQNSNAALAIQAMLENVGITVALDNTGDTATMIGKWVKHDFDTVVFGINLGNDDQAIWNLASFFLSTSPNNRSGLKDAALDDDIRALFAADTDAAKKAAYGKVETELNAQMTVLSMGVSEEFIGWSDKLHGAQPDLKTNLHLDKAWLG